MHIKGKYSWVKHLDFMLIDVLVLIIAFAISYYLKFGVIYWLYRDSWRALLIFVCLLDIVITLFYNPYSGTLRRSFSEDVSKNFILTIYNLVASCFFFYLLKIGTLFSREMLFVMYAIYFFLGLVVKYIWKKLMGRNRKQIPLYVVCEKDKEDEVIHNSLAEDLPMYEVIGSSNEDGFISDLLSKNAQEILIAIKPGEISKETYEQLIANGIGIHMNIESMIGFQTEDQFVTKVGVYKTLTVGAYSFTPSQLIYLGLKRVFDIICGLIGLVVLVPLSLIVKIVSLISGDTKSIFYTQKRIGLNGKIIMIFKFRSMVPNADEVLEEMLKDEKYRKEWEENQKFENDPRITKIGNFLRKTSLDEVPQLLNVLKGEMSLVGPRPLVEGELEAHDGLKLYNSVKPGITGWWGCNGRSNIDYRERLELEYYYVKHCSLYLDILCIFKTVFVVLKREGSK